MRNDGNRSRSELTIRGDGLQTHDPETLLHDGRFVRLARRGVWEYATRANATGVVAVVAQHDDGRLVLIEQSRPAVGACVVELPAGLVGDEDAGESLLAAAQRELAEETGYTARKWARLDDAWSSPGLTDERVTFFHAVGLWRDRAADEQGWGVDGEAINVHEIELTALPAQLATWRSSGTAIDMKLLAGLYAAAIPTERTHDEDESERTTQAQ